MASYNLRHWDIELVEQLFLKLPIAVSIRIHFVRILSFQRAATSSFDLWRTWLRGLSSAHRHVCSLLARKIIWKFWLGRNDCIFNSTTLSLYSLYFKIWHMFLSWVDAIPNSKRQKLKELSTAVRHCIMLLGPSTHEECDPDDIYDHATS